MSDPTEIPAGLPEDKLPFAPDAERAVLGSILMDPGLYALANQSLQAHDFYREAHRTIFAAMSTMGERGETPDMTAVIEYLRGVNKLESVGGQTYLAQLIEAFASHALVEQYIQIIRDRSQSRSLICTAQTIVQAGLEATFEKVGEYVDFAESRLLETVRSSSRGSVLEMKSILKETLDKIETLCQEDATITGVTSGFRDLDDVTHGLHGGELIIVAARPGMGKSAFALNIAANAALQKGSHVLLFSLEMSPEQLGMRLIAQEGRVPLQRLRNGTLLAEDWEPLHTAMAQLVETNIYLDTTPALSVIDVVSKARRLHMEGRCDMVMIDYLQLINGRPGIDSREQQVADVSRSLKQLSLELDIPVIALSQLNRSVESRKPPRPMLSDLRESGAIEQDADVIMFLYRDDYYNEDSEQKGMALVDIAKQRSGPTGTIDLKFTDKYTRFDNLDTGYLEGDLSVTIGGIDTAPIPPPPSPIESFDDDDFSGMI